MIGNWNNESVILAILPKCLQLGTNPTDYLPLSTVSFPTYTGPAASSKIQAQFLNNSSSDLGYKNGTIDTSYNDTSAIGLIRYGYQLSADNSSDHTIEIWFELEGPRETSTHYLPIRAINSGTIFWDFQLTYDPGYLGESGLVLPWYRKDPAFALFAGEVVGNHPTSGLHHIVAVKNGSNIISYLDGQLCTAYSGFEFAYTMGAVNFGNLQTNAWNGKIHSLIVRNDAQSLSQIESSYALGPTLGGLQGFDQGDGSLSLSLPASPKVKRLITTSTNDLSYYYPLAWGKRNR